MSTIKVGVNDVTINKEVDLCTARRDFTRYYKESAKATISVIAYNRLETTKTCVESILRNTKEVDYKLILVYNDNEGQEEILNYFESVDYHNKQVIHIEKNIGPALAYAQVFRNLEGDYYIGVQSDVIVTPNWLSNLIACAESDVKIGMVSPVSSNVSNLQWVDLEFSNYEEMQEAAGRFNVSDPRKWEERIRLINLGALFKRPCLEAIGDPFDVGFFNDFGDDDMSFRVRRAGYKCVLAGDTWVHHDHSFAGRDQKKLNESIGLGRNNFKEKYYGIDAWDDVVNFHREYTETITQCTIESPKVLGIDVKCGTPLLEIKNALRKLGIYQSEMHAYTQNAKYLLDLQTVCGEKNVTCGEIDSFAHHYIGKKYDYIVVGENINTFKNPIELIKVLSMFLSEEGKMFVSLKNTRNIFSFLYDIGYFGTSCSENALDITVEKLINDVVKQGLKIKFIRPVPYDNQKISAEDCKAVQEMISQISQKDISEVMGRLSADRYAFEIFR